MTVLGSSPIQRNSSCQPYLEMLDVPCRLFRHFSKLSALQISALQHLSPFADGYLSSHLLLETAVLSYFRGVGSDGQKKDIWLSDVVAKETIWRKRRNSWVGLVISLVWILISLVQPYSLLGGKEPHRGKYAQKNQLSDLHFPLGIFCASW